MTKIEAIAKALEIIGVKYRTRKAALKAIANREIQLAIFEAKRKATDGRSAA